MRTLALKPARCCRPDQGEAETPRRRGGASSVRAGATSATRPSFVERDHQRDAASGAGVHGLRPGTAGASYITRRGIGFSGVIGIGSLLERARRRRLGGLRLPGAASAERRRIARQLPVSDDGRHQRTCEDQAMGRHHTPPSRASTILIEQLPTARRRRQPASASVSSAKAISAST